MRKDWVSWMVCVLVFGAGAVWAQIPIATSFFRVEDIHDLFEIVSSLATVVAVALAYMGLSTWRQQIKGHSEHALATRVSIECRRYKDSLAGAWADAHFSLLQSDLGEDSLPADLWATISGRMASQLQEREEIKTMFQAALLEVRALWGVEIAAKYDHLLNFGEACDSCVRAFNSWSDRNGQEMVRALNKYGLERSRVKFKENGWMDVDGKVSVLIESLAREADSVVRQKLLAM